MKRQSKVYANSKNDIEHIYIYTKRYDMNNNIYKVSNGKYMHMY